MTTEALVRSVELLPAKNGEERAGYPWELAAIQALANGLALHPKVTYLIGENGSGKSTLLEAVAVAAGMNAEGGSSNFAFSTRLSRSALAKSLPLVRGAARPSTPFSPRAESLFTAASYLAALHREGGDPLASCGGAWLRA